MVSAPGFRAERVRFGIVEACIALALRRLSRWFRYYQIATRELGNQPIETPRIDRECRILNVAEIKALSDDFAKQFEDDFIEAALERGDVCVGALVDGQVVAYTWRAYEKAPHTDGLWIRLKRPYRYSYKAFVKPEYRGLRILAPPVSDPYCLARGYKYVLNFIERSNLPSLARHRRQEGYDHVGYALILTLFNRRFIYHSGGVRRIGFAFYEACDTSP